MKRIDAFINPHELEMIRSALQTAGVRSLILHQAQCLGGHPPRKAIYRGIAYLQETEGRVEVTALVDDLAFDRAVASIRRTASQGEILVSSVDEVMRV